MAETAFPPLEQPVAVIQPLPGIGDMVWHLPHIRAIAAHAGAPVTLLTKPRAMADQMLTDEPSVETVQWIDLNPPGRRGAHDGIGGFQRLVRKLYGFDFGSVVMLHHSTLIAAACWRAGIPDRRGYGAKRQRWFLNTGPFLPPEAMRTHQHARATQYLALSGIPMGSAEPSLTVPETALAEARVRLGDHGTPYVAIGIGSSEALRQWGTQRFIALARALAGAGWPMLVLTGGNEDLLSATQIQQAMEGSGCDVRAALGWNLTDVAGMLAQAAFYVGNNTGVMNMAAACGVRTYALFGTTAVFDHARQIVPVTAPDNGTHDGMGRVTVEAVLAVIEADRGRLGA
jgi:heptosyltransferase-2